jgi:hypothetical protein
MVSAQASTMDKYKGDVRSGEVNRAMIIIVLQNISASGTWG